MSHPSSPHADARPPEDRDIDPNAEGLPLRLRRCIVPLCATIGIILGVMTALSAWFLAGLDTAETTIGTLLGAIMGAGLGTAAGLVASVLVDPRDLVRLCELCRRPIGSGGDCPDCGCDDHRHDHRLGVEGGNASTSSASIDP